MGSTQGNRWVAAGRAASRNGFEAGNQAATGALPGPDPRLRRGVLGDRGIRAEVERMTSQSHGAPVSGFYTYGEIARTHGVTGFHNQTLVVLAVS